MSDKIEKILEEFWYIEEGESPQGASDSSIKRVEKIWKKKLPKDFIELLKISDGGIPWLADYVTEDDKYRLFEMFSASGSGKHPPLIPPQDYDNEDVPENVMVFSASGHSWFAFDYRIQEEPRIVYFDEYENLLVEIAKDFREFLNGLSS